MSAEKRWDSLREATAFIAICTVLGAGDLRAKELVLINQTSPGQ